METPDLAAMKRNHRINTALDRAGKTLIALGLLLLSFVGYQLFGTGIAESQAQSKLKSQFSAATTVPNASPTTTVAPVVRVIPKTGDVVAKIIIEKIGLNKFVVAGSGYKTLEKGPGLFTRSPLPGQLGNVAIAGHRTTYGAPFGRLDELVDGDRVVFETPQAKYVYVVDGAPKIVKPSNVDVLRTVDPTRATLTLITCHPKWTSKNRLVVKAELLSSITPQQPTVFVANETSTESALAEGWFHDPSAWPMVIVFALLLSAIAFGTRRLIHAGKKALWVYPVATFVFLPTLFVFFGYLTRLLPTNL